VRASLAAMQAKKQADARGTVHGLVFEEQLGAWLASEAQRAGDVHEAVGGNAGTIPRCKTGDHVVELGAESAAPGVRIVWEAKQVQGYTIRKALDEIGEARRNRVAQIGVFVFSRRAAPEGLDSFQRHGPDLVVVWDPEDPSTDLVLKLAYSGARALAVRETASEEAHAVAAEIDKAVRALEHRLRQLDEISAWGSTVESNGRKIQENARKIRDEIVEQVGAIDAQVSALKRKDGA
jgi:hypothetical protein